MIRVKDNKYFFRLRLAKYANEYGIRSAARMFQCSRNTVRLWVRRLNKGGQSSLKDKSRAPKTCPHKISKSRERNILEIRQRAPCFGPIRMRDLCGINASASAIYRVLRENQLVRKPRRKHQKKNDLRAIKAQYKVWERMQCDVKHLKDIPFYWPQMKALKLPRYQYTLRDVKSGALFLGYATELSSTYATLFVRSILEHLERKKVSLGKTILSTDNGGEFGGQERTERKRGFHSQVERYGLTHRFLPPATPNAHGDVETVHNLIEQEFFDLETFRSQRDFWEKIRTYQYWWNFARKNYSKGKKTPLDFLLEEGNNLSILFIEPINIDLLFRNIDHSSLVGQDLPVLPVF